MKLPLRSLQLRFDDDPSKYLISAVTLGAVSNLENIICSIGGGQVDQRSYCQHKLDGLRDNVMYCPADLRARLQYFLQHFETVILYLEKLNVWCEMPDARISFSASRSILGICNIVLTTAAKIKVWMVQNMHVLHADVLDVLSTNITDLVTYVESVPVNIDTSLRVNMSKTLSAA